MSITTKAPTPVTSTVMKTTIELEITTIGNYSTESSEATTNITTTIVETTTDVTDSTTNVTEKETTYSSGGGGGGDAAAIAGGCVGAVIFIALVIIVVVIFLMRRRKKRKSLKKVPEPPGKDFLDTIHERNAIKYHRENNAQDKHYVNLTPGGDTDEQTDPSVGNDGYLKKKKPKHNKHKKHNANGKVKAKASSGRIDDEVSTEPPIYTNELVENGKEPVRRMNSVPFNEAPPPPRKSSEYATGRVPGNTDSQDNEQSVDSTLNKDYVNLRGQQTGEAVFDVPPTKSNGNKLTTHSSGERKKKQKNVSGAETEETDPPQKIYENINHGANYYNLRDNQQEGIQRQSTYEDVGEESGTAFQQDDVYENQN